MILVHVHLQHVSIFLNPATQGTLGSGRLADCARRVTLEILLITVVLLGSSCLIVATTAANQAAEQLLTEAHVFIVSAF